MHRRRLQKTRASRLLLMAIYLGILLQILAGAFLIYLGAKHKHNLAGGIAFGLAVVFSYPFVWAYLLLAPIIIGRYFINGPQTAEKIDKSSQIFASHPGKKIAVTGSYGKTTMKELLKTVLSEKFKVAATPANKNVSISHARFADTLSGKEDVLVIEYGEAEPGDVARFARLTHPTHAIITGLAPAHLDHYKTLKAAGEDIFSVADYLAGKQVYVHDDAASQPFIKPKYEKFSESGALGWKISGVKVDISGVSFVMKKGSDSLKLSSSLIGRHQVCYLAFVAALGLEFDMTKREVTSGIAKTTPYEHRLQPYQLAGAWIIDDTYNGNLEGIRVRTR